MKKKNIEIRKYDEMKKASREKEDGIEFES
jgi:hypothetical protein